MKKALVLLLLLAAGTALRAGSCPEACRDVCGTSQSCCPAKGERCSSVQLERGGTPSSAYSSKGGLRLR